jgi:hypothetical protein
MTSSAPQTNARGGLVAGASLVAVSNAFSLSAGMFLMMAVDYFARGDGPAWACAGATVFLMVAAFIVGRQALTLLALQLPFPKVSESMGNHDSKIAGAGSVD